MSGTTVVPCPSAPDRQFDQFHLGTNAVIPERIYDQIDPGGNECQRGQGGEINFRNQHGKIKNSTK